MKFWFSSQYTHKNSAWWTVTKPVQIRKQLADLPYAEEVDVTKPIEHDLTLRFHTEDYIKHLESGDYSHLGFEWTRETYNSARYRTQGQLEAAEYAYKNKTATFNIGSGFHHAEPDYAMGYCTLNGLVLTHIALKQKYPALKTAVLDVDAHFGNGCSHYAEKDNSFIHLDMSLRISQNSLEDYMTRLKWSFEKLKFFKPDLIQLNNGMDVLKGDPVGHGIFTLDEALERDSIIYNYTKDNEFPVVTTLAGGYQPDAITGHINSFKKAAEIWK